jgi:tetratricopeptide (TPR) repeat protein
VNRALADAWFVNRDFTAAAKLYNRLLEQGDSTFNTLYSAGMCYSQIEDLEQAYHYLQLAFLISGMQHYGCAYRLGVVCVDTKRYPEGLGYLDLAKQLMQPDTTIMKAITLSQGEGYYLTQHYDEAVTAWKEHLTYNPTSIATYYNIANAYAYLLKDREQAESYYRQFLDLARKEEKPTDKLNQMIKSAEEVIKAFDLSRKSSKHKKQ